jgi:hypothetical protein
LRDRRAPQRRRFFTLSQNRSTRLHSLIAKTRSLQDREWIKTRSFDTQSSDRLGRIGQPVEVPFHSARAQVHAFGERRERAAQIRCVLDGRKYIDALPARFGLRVSFDQLQQMLVFESCKRLPVHES